MAPCTHELFPVWTGGASVNKEPIIHRTILVCAWCGHTRILDEHGRVTVTKDKGEVVRAVPQNQHEPLQD